jgi:hypothetical protein
LKKQIRAAHYRALRVIHGQQKSRDELDRVSNRGTPDEYADFNLAKMIVKMVCSGSLSRLLQTTLAGSYAQRQQPGRLFFFIIINVFKIQAHNIRQMNNISFKRIERNFYKL